MCGDKTQAEEWISLPQLLYPTYAIKVSKLEYFLAKLIWPVQSYLLTHYEFLSSRVLDIWIAIFFITSQMERQSVGENFYICAEIFFLPS